MTGPMGNEARGSGEGSGRRSWPQVVVDRDTRWFWLFVWVPVLDRTVRFRFCVCGDLWVIGIEVMDHLRLVEGSVVGRSSDELACTCTATL